MQHWRWLQVNGTKQQAASCKRQALASLTRKNYNDYRRKEKEIMKVKEAIKITEGFTRTSKMPGLSYSLPAWECKTGSKLRKIKGSVCASCYALKGNYTRYPAIKAAQYRRLEAMKHPAWVDAMVTVIKRQKWFRWHDAGDVQDLQHLNNIFKICEATPDTKHWLPTREAWIKNELDRAPANLVIRFSPPMMGQRNDSWPNSSMVVETGAILVQHPSQGGKCGTVDNVGIQ